MLAAVRWLTVFAKLIKRLDKYWSFMCFFVCCVVRYDDLQLNDY